MQLINKFDSIEKLWNNCSYLRWKICTRHAYTAEKVFFGKSKLSGLSLSINFPGSLKYFRRIQWAHCSCWNRMTMHSDRSLEWLNLKFRKLSIYPPLNSLSQCKYTSGYLLSLPETNNCPQLSSPDQWKCTSDYRSISPGTNIATICMDSSRTAEVKERLENF